MGRHDRSPVLGFVLVHSDSSGSGETGSELAVGANPLPISQTAKTISCIAKGGRHDIKVVYVEGLERTLDQEQCDSGQPTYREPPRNELCSIQDVVEKQPRQAEEEQDPE